MSNNSNILIFKNNTLQLNQCRDGFWLYDKTQKMNLAMRATGEREAFIEALEYYQKRLEELQTDHVRLRRELNRFVQILHEDHEITPDIED